MDKQHKKACSIPCSETFKTKIHTLAEKHSVNPADIIRSILFVFPEEFIQSFEDPGDPLREDREDVTLHSGKHKGKTWKRKPRIQVRIPRSYPVPFLRKALNIALSLQDDNITQLLTSKKIDEEQKEETEQKIKNLTQEQERLTKEIELLQSVLKNFTKEKENKNIQSIDDALFILGFPPYSSPTAPLIKKKYRDLAILFHPDTGLDNHAMMSKLNDAISFLRKMKYL